jgi:hypothetical protein
MSDDDDVLGRELSVEVRLDKSGVKASAKSRAFAAFDHLVGSAIDIPIAGLEGIAQRVRARNRVKEGKILLEEQRIREGLPMAQSPDDRALHAVLVGEARKLTNRAAVSEEAIKALEAHGSEDEAEPNEAPMDEDWLNVFGSHAEKASSEQLRHLWGKILAGEIRRPGAFSLTTLRVIAELDQHIARTFEEAVKLRLDGGLLPKVGKMEGRRLIDLTFLEEVGLLQEVHGSLKWKWNPNDEGHFYVSQGDSLIKVVPKAGRTEMEVPVIRITRVGQEIASILPKESDDVGLRAVVSLIEDQADEIHLFRRGLQEWIHSERIKGSES